MLDLEKNDQLSSTVIPHILRVALILGPKGPLNKEKLIYEFN
jgi:hypothetical protein